MPAARQALPTEVSHRPLGGASELATCELRREFLQGAPDVPGRLRRKLRDLGQFLEIIAHRVGSELALQVDNLSPVIARRSAPQVSMSVRRLWQAKLVSSSVIKLVALSIASLALSVAAM